MLVLHYCRLFRVIKNFSLYLLYRHLQKQEKKFRALNYETLWAVEDAVHLSSIYLLCVSSQWAYNQLLAALHTAIVGH